MPEASDNIQKVISRFGSLLDDLEYRFSEHLDKSKEQDSLIISIASQQLYLFQKQSLVQSYPISSAENGIGNLSGSNKTPLGVHQISEKFGYDTASASIFKARKNTHTIAKILHSKNEKSADDNITSRILWLDGLEDGINKGTDAKGNNVDSHSRYIYIHGTDEEGRLGQPASHGCIRMANQDVIELFDQVDIGCLVLITEI